MTSRKPGRRPGDPDVTRRSILSSAREVFAELGFERATIRRIAARAGVDPGLVHHYFGTKKRLFAKAHELPFDPDELLGHLRDGPPDQLGERIARFYISAIGRSSSPAVSIIRSAATNPAAAQMLREFVEDVLLRHADTVARGPDPRLRMALVGSHMLGLMFGRAIVGVAELADAEDEELVAAVAPVIQHYLTAADLTSVPG